jgi:F420-0:gamma-glutamyl ligase
MPDAHGPSAGHVVTVIGLAGIPELDETDDLALLIHEAAIRVGGLQPADVVVVAQ